MKLVKKCKFNLCYFVLLNKGNGYNLTFIFKFKTNFTEFKVKKNLQVYGPTCIIFNIHHHKFRLLGRLILM